jgi:hypothetical protein
MIMSWIILNLVVMPNVSLRPYPHPHISSPMKAISRNRFVHHTSFLWNYSPLNMNYLQVS